MGMIRRPWWSEANGQIWPGCRGHTSTLFERHPGIFNDHRESGPRFNVSSEGRCYFDSIVSPSLYWGVRTPQTTGWAPAAGLTNTSSSSNLVFPRRSPIQVLTSSTLLSFSGATSFGLHGSDMAAGKGSYFILDVFNVLMIISQSIKVNVLIVFMLNCKSHLLLLKWDMGKLGTRTWLGLRSQQCNYKFN